MRKIKVLIVSKMSYSKEGCEKLLELFKLDFDKDFTNSNLVEFKKKIEMFTEIIKKERGNLSRDSKSYILERNIWLLNQLREVNEKLRKLSEEIKEIQNCDEKFNAESKKGVSSDVQNFYLAKEILMSSLACLKEQLHKEFKLYNELVELCIQD